MRNKIIHLTFRGYKNYFPKPEEPEFYSGGWASTQAEASVKQYPELVHEVWRAEYEIDIEKIGYFNNVKGRLFPYGKILKKYKLYPWKLIRELKKELNNNNVVINLHTVHTLSSIIIIFIFRNYPIVIHHHGDTPYRYQNSKSSFKKLIKSLFIRLDEKVLKHVDYFSVISKREKEYLVNIIGSQNVVIEQGRKFYSYYKPIEKLTARKKLGLPLDKKIILYVGYYYRLKGVDAILETYKKLKNKYDVLLIFAGGGVNDELYGKVKDADAIDLGIIDNDSLIEYFSAADVYILFSENSNLVQYGGFGTAPIEAMACNCPIVSTQLYNFPNNDWKYIGEIPQNRSDIYNCVERIFENPYNYTPRIKSQPFYDFEIILKSNFEEYNKLLKKYYDY